MADSVKLIDPQYIRKTLNLAIIQFVNDELFRKALNDSLQTIVDFINQQKILQLGELGWYVEKPENGMIVYASGWTELYTVSNGLKRHSGFNPNYPPAHTIIAAKYTNGTDMKVGDGRGLWFYMGSSWYKIGLTVGTPL